MKEIFLEINDLSPCTDNLIHTDLSRLLGFTIGTGSGFAANLWGTNFYANL